MTRAKFDRGILRDERERAIFAALSFGFRSRRGDARIRERAHAARADAHRLAALPPDERDEAPEALLAFAITLRHAYLGQLPELPSQRVTRNVEN
jgi:hypothetical protein